MKNGRGIKNLDSIELDLFGAHPFLDDCRVFPAPLNRCDSIPILLFTKFTVDILIISQYKKQN